MSQEESNRAPGLQGLFDKDMNSQISAHISTLMFEMYSLVLDKLVHPQPSISMLVIYHRK